MKKNVNKFMWCFLAICCLFLTSKSTSIAATVVASYHYTGSSNNYATALEVVKQDNGKYSLKITCDDLEDVIGEDRYDINNKIEVWLEDIEGEYISYTRYFDVSMSSRSFQVTATDYDLKEGEMYQLYVIGLDEWDWEINEPISQEFYLPFADVDINASTFPDEVFRNYVKKNIDKDENNRLSEEERKAITILEINEKKIADLKGIEYFPELKELYAVLCGLEQVDLSKNTKLAVLDLHSNQLTSIDISANKYLTDVDLSRNNDLSDITWADSYYYLHKLDISFDNIVGTFSLNIFPFLEEVKMYGNMSLKEIATSNNYLKVIMLDSCSVETIDFTECPNVEVIYASDNQLKKVDFSKNANLKELRIGDNSFTKLDLSGHVKLEELFCSGCDNLKKIDVTGCKKLNQLECDDNVLEELILSGCEGLELLYANINKLEKVDISDCKKLLELNISDNPNLSQLDLSKNKELGWLMCYNNSLTSLDITNTSIYKEADKAKPYFCAGPGEEGKVHDIVVCCTKQQKEYDSKAWEMIAEMTPDLLPMYTGGVKMQVGHKMEKVVVKKATASADGKVEEHCKSCGSLGKTTVIKKASNIKLASNEYTYTGKAVKPEVKVKNSAGTTLKKDKDYEITYASGCKDIGKYKVTIKGIGNYSYTKTLSFTINPKGTTITSLTPASKAFTAKWKKQTQKTAGYEIRYSTSSKMSNSKKVSVNKNTTVSKKIDSLKSGTKYYVQVRTYQKVGKNKFYSEWSKTETVKTK